VIPRIRLPGCLRRFRKAPNESLTDKAAKRRLAIRMGCMQPPCLSTKPTATALHFPTHDNRADLVREVFQKFHAFQTGSVHSSRLCAVAEEVLAGSLRCPDTHAGKRPHFRIPPFFRRQTNLKARSI